MVKDFIQRFEGGVDGANVTAVSSGAGTGGDAFSSIIFNSGTDVTTAGNSFFKHDAASAINGSMGALFTTAAVTNNSYASWTIPTGHGRRAIMRYPIKIPSLPAVTQILSRIDTQSGIFSQVKINTAGKLTISGGSPNADIVASTSTNALALNTQYFLEHRVTIGTTTSNGVVEYELFTNSRTDGTGVDTSVGGIAYANTAQNMGTDAEFGGTASRFRFYCPFSNSGWATLPVDLWRARVTSNLTDILGTYVSTLPPTGSTVLYKDIAQISVTGADGVTPYLYSITQLSGPAATATLVPGTDNTWRVPRPTTADAVWRVVVTDSSGQTSPNYDVTVPKATGGTPPMSVLVWNGTAWV
jgi:hypothetical protein